MSSCCWRGPASCYRRAHSLRFEPDRWRRPRDVARGALPLLRRDSPWPFMEILLGWLAAEAGGARDRSSGHKATRPARRALRRREPSGRGGCLSRLGQLVRLRLGEPAAGPSENGEIPLPISAGWRRTGGETARDRRAFEDVQWADVPRAGASAGRYWSSGGSRRVGARAHRRADQRLKLESICTWAATTIVAGWHSDTDQQGLQTATHEVGRGDHRHTSSGGCSEGRDTARSAPGNSWALEKARSDPAGCLDDLRCTLKPATHS